MDSGLRRNDEGVEAAFRGNEEKKKALGSRFRGNDEKNQGRSDENKKDEQKPELTTSTCTRS